VENHHTAGGLRERVTMGSHLNDRQVFFLLSACSILCNAAIDISRKLWYFLHRGINRVLLEQDEVSHARTMISLSGIGSGKDTCFIVYVLFPWLLMLLVTEISALTMNLQN
jgi:hypothetical protein